MTKRKHYQTQRRRLRRVLNRIGDTIALLRRGAHGKGWSAGYRERDFTSTTGYKEN